MSRFAIGNGQRLGAALELACLASSASAYSVYGAIGDKYAALARDGGVMGPPTSDETPAPYGGRFNSFGSGYIYWHPYIGAHAVWGEIGRKWDQPGRVDCFVAFSPRMGEIRNSRDSAREK